MLQCDHSYCNIFFMAITYQIDIDSYIGDGAYSKQYVRNVLEQNSNKPVNVRMNSLGGSLDHGLDIADRFANHGDVTVDLFALNASAATVATLGAKTVRMSSSAFYLIHKALTTVFLIQQVNADNIDQIISDLSDQKDNLQKFDLAIAKKYVDKTGKSMDEIMNLMKKGGWLNAEEAKTWGFVDEIFDTKEKVNTKDFKNKIEAFGLPTNCISEKDLFTNIIISNSMKKQPLKINALLNITNLESTEEGIYLNEEQVHSLDGKVIELENSVATITTEKTTAENRATTAETAVATKDTEIAELTTQVTNLKAGAGDTTKGNPKSTDTVVVENAVDDFFTNMAAAKGLFDLIK